MFKVINWMMVLPVQYQRRYWQAVVALDKEHKMELLNPLEQMFLDDGVKIGLKNGLAQGLERGLQQGLAKGRELGRKEGASALLERQLAQRFGPLPKTVKSKLTRASLPQLEAWSDALSAATSLRQVFK